MKFKEYLTERMILSFQIKRKGTVDIYVNPSIVEIRNAFNGRMRGVRFVLDYKNKSIYLWSAEFFHMDVVSTLKAHTQEGKYSDVLSDDNRGRAWNLEGKKLSKVELDNKIPEEHIGWVSEYLDLTNVEYHYEV